MRWVRATMRARQKPTNMEIDVFRLRQRLGALEDAVFGSQESAEAEGRARVPRFEAALQALEKGLCGANEVIREQGIQAKRVREDTEKQYAGLKVGMEKIECAVKQFAELEIRMTKLWDSKWVAVEALEKSMTELRNQLEDVVPRSDMVDVWKAVAGLQERADYGPRAPRAVGVSEAVSEEVRGGIQWKGPPRAMTPQMRAASVDALRERVRRSASEQPGNMEANFRAMLQEMHGLARARSPSTRSEVQ